MMRKTPMPRPFSGWFARVRSPRRLPARLSAVAAAWLAGLCVAQAAPSGVVTLGGSVTEIVYGLGQGARLVGDDQSSLYPPKPAGCPAWATTAPCRSRACCRSSRIWCWLRSRPVRRTRSSAWARSACAW